MEKKLLDLFNAWVTAICLGYEAQRGAAARIRRLTAGGPAAHAELRRMLDDGPLLFTAGPLIAIAIAASTQARCAAIHALVRNQDGMDIRRGP